MTRAILLRPAAQQDLRAIIDYTTGRWGAEQAADYAESIRSALGRVGENADIRSDRSLIVAGLRKVSIGSHAAYYFADAKTITVSRILHSKQDAFGAPID